MTYNMFLRSATAPWEIFVHTRALSCRGKKQKKTNKTNKSVLSDIEKNIDEVKKYKRNVILARSCSGANFLSDILFRRLPEVHLYVFIPLWIHPCFRIYRVTS